MSDSSTVLDLGAGTGILGALAVSAGAAHVYAVDRTNLAALAQDIAAHNHLDQVEVVQGDSLDVELPARVDVVVCDQMGPLGIEAGVVEALADAADRHLSPGGTLIPQRLDLAWVPASAPGIAQMLRPWREGVAGLDLSPALEWVLNQEYGTRLESQDLRGEVVPSACIELGTRPQVLDLSGTSTITSAGTLDGIAAWFTAVLAPGIAITNAPHAEEAIDRDLALLPLAAPVQVVPGDVVDATICVRPATTHITWTVDVHHRDGRVSAGDAQSTLRGELLSGPDLRRQHPDHRPELTRRGTATRYVLDRCDGSHALSAVVDDTVATFPDLFTTRDAAARFVRDVLAGLQR